MDIKTENNLKNNYRFKIINNENVYILNIILLIILTSALIYGFNKHNIWNILIEFNEEIVILILFIIFIYLLNCYISFNNAKIKLKELYFTQDCQLYIKYSFLGKLKEAEFNLNELFFRVESRLNHDNEIVIHNKKYKRLFKLRGNNGLSSEDLDKIAISFKNAEVKEFKKTTFGKETYKDNWRIIKTNYLSKDFFRNFWYV